MSNIRLFFPESLSLNLSSKLDKSQSHYLNKVMRVRTDETFSLFNNSGEWEAKINGISKGIVEGKVDNCQVCHGEFTLLSPHDMPLPKK